MGTFVDADKLVAGSYVVCRAAPVHILVSFRLLMVLSSRMFCCSDQPVKLCLQDPLKFCFVMVLFSLIIQFFIYKHMPDYRNHFVCYMCYCYMMTISFSYSYIEFF